MPIIRKPESNLLSKLTEVEKSLGVDLKLTKDNDLELNNLNDINLSIGAKNAGQAANIRLFTQLGDNLLHPEIGTDLQIGEKIVNALDIQGQVIRTLSNDPRFENVTAQVQVDGNTVFVDARISIKNTGQRVPLQFTVER